MILNTRRLFCRLLRTLDIETVCDVGSMDGSDALLFRRSRPSASILALEPNARNLALMEADDRLRRERIRVLPFAASDRRSEAPFFVVKADYSAEGDRSWRGMSSLHERSDRSQLAEIALVQTVRLDELLAAESLDRGPIALWIDTEGMAFEVVCGASALMDATSLIHVEVETATIIGAKQKLFADVEKALIETGFSLLATDQPRHCLQFNALFVRAELLRAKAPEVFFWANAFRLRRLIGRRVLRFPPSRLRRTLARLGGSRAD